MIVPAVRNINTILILLECLKWKKLLAIKKKRSINIGYIAGYILNAATNSPCNNRFAERCIPQPGHSIPNNFLLRHGSM